VNAYLDAADWQGQVDTFRGIYAERRDAMMGALGEFLPDLSWTRPDGGFFVWLTLPESLDSKGMLPRAVKELVAYTPGTAFYADGRGGGNIRLSFCYPTPEQIRVGVKRLATVINDELELIETFGHATRPSAVSESRSTVVAPPPNVS